MKLPANSAGLPSNVILLSIVPGDPAQGAGLAGHVPAHKFHVISEGLIDQIKLLAGGHTRIIDRLGRMDARLDRMEKENQRQHLETCALVKLSF